MCVQTMTGTSVRGCPVRQSVESMRRPFGTCPARLGHQLHLSRFAIMTREVCGGQV
jgi:hypothetical protein